MTSRAACWYFVVLALAIPLLNSCATSSSTRSGNSFNGLIGEPAVPVPLSDPHAQQLLQQFAPNAVRSVQGSALLQISEPGQSDRLQMQFTGIAGKNHIRLKTSVGIPAAEIYSDPDSLILLNLADSYAEIVPRGAGQDQATGQDWTGQDWTGQDRATEQDRAATEDSADPSTTALAARQPWTVPATANLLDILHPSVTPGEVQSLTYIEGTWKLTLKTGEVWTLRGEQPGKMDGKQRKNPFTLVRRDNLTGTLGSIADSIEYLGTVEIDGQILPRRVSILNETRQSRILVQIRSLEINGQDRPLEILRPDIPADFTVIRPA